MEQRTKVTVMDETVVKMRESQNCTNPLSFWRFTQSKLWIPVHFKGFFLNLLYVNTVLNSGVGLWTSACWQATFCVLPWLPKDINLALEWTMYDICSVSTWWKQLLTAAIMFLHKIKKKKNYLNQWVRGPSLKQQLLLLRANGKQ